MKWPISLLMSDLSSAFLSLHLWPEYLWNTWIMATMPPSSSDMLSFEACKKHFTVMCWWCFDRDIIICFYAYNTGIDTCIANLSYEHLLQFHMCKINIQSNISSDLPPSQATPLSCKDPQCIWWLMQQYVDCHAQFTVHTKLYWSTTWRLLLFRALCNAHLMDMSGQSLH